VIFAVACLMLAQIAAAPPAESADPLERQTRKGPVEATVRLEPADPSIGDNVTLTLRVVAAKDVELLMPQFGEMMDRFAIVDFREGRRVDEQGRTVATQDYELQVSRSGKQTILPIMIEFVDRRPDATAAPEGDDAYELLTEQLTFDVTSVLPDRMSADLHPPLGPLAPHADGGRGAWWWAMGGAVLVAVAAVAWRQVAAARRRAVRRSAYEIAGARLDRLTRAGALSPDRIDEFFVELSAIVRWYLETRFDLRAPELTTEEFLDVMSRSPDLTGEHQLLLREFLRRADLVKFANFKPTDDDIDRSIASARRFLDDTRREAPLVEESAASPKDPGAPPPQVEPPSEVVHV
jgi:hypothetical protein